MNVEQFFDGASQGFEDEEEEEMADAEKIPCNRIFINFAREFRHPAKDRYNMVKVKGLFKYLDQRQDLQAMKVSGWLEGEKEESEKGREDEREVEEDRDQLESFYGDDERCQKGGGQRFAMSRDFWYRKLNILKAQKLDEVALEARDMPENVKSRDPKCVEYLKTRKIFSDEIPVKEKEVIEELDFFTQSVAKPVEKILKDRFVNVYESLDRFKGA